MSTLETKTKSRFSRLFDIISKESESNGQLQEVMDKLRGTEAELETRQRILEKASLISESDLKGNVTYANEKFCEVSGYKIEELLGKPHSIVRHQDTSPEVFKDMWSTIGRGNVWQGEIKNKCKDGSPYWVIATVAPVVGENGKPRSYISVRFDITPQILAKQDAEQHLAQIQMQDEEIRQTMEELEATVEEIERTRAELQTRVNVLNTAALVSETDKKGIITFVNDKFCDVAQYDPQALLGQPHNIVRHPDMPAAAFKDMWATIGRGNVWHGEVKNRKKDGSHYWVEATIAPVLGADGKPERYIGIRFDITDVKDQEEMARQQSAVMGNELKDNVNYAQRIHAAVLQKPDELDQSFPDNFTYYLPHSVISGDFYWFGKQRNKSLVCLGDSTGHGVSAGFISVMAIDKLRKYVEERAMTEPAGIVDELDHELRGILQGDEHVKDTIDMAFLSFDFRRKVIHYTGANRPIWVIRNGEIIELAKQRFSIGEQQVDQDHVETEQFNIEPGDRIYAFSDGITDQFGGSNGKKLGTKRLREFLLSSWNQPMPQQKTMLKQLMDDWRGDRQQTDDILVIGMHMSPELFEE